MSLTQARFTADDFVNGKQTAEGNVRFWRVICETRTSEGRVNRKGGGNIEEEGCCPPGRHPHANGESVQSSYRIEEDVKCGTLDGTFVSAVINDMIAVVALEELCKRC